MKDEKESPKRSGQFIFYRVHKRFWGEPIMLKVGIYDYKDLDKLEDLMIEENFSKFVSRMILTNKNVLVARIDKF
jgi:hypothetical protein